MKAAKIWAMGILAGGSWIADWFLLEKIIYHSQTLSLILWQFAVTILGIIFLTFFLLVNKNKIVSAVLNLVIFAAYILIFPKELYAILGGIVFLGLLFLFEQRLGVEEKSRLNFSLRRVMSESVTVTIYALLLLVGFNVYNSIQADFKTNPDAYYQKLGQAAVATVPYLTKALPGHVDMNQTFDQFASTQAGTDNPSVIDQYKQQFLNQFAVKASGNETLSDIFAQVAVDKIKQSVGGYERYFPFLFAISVTALLWTFAFLVRWASMIFGLIIYRILLAVGFFKIEKVQVEVEKLMV